MWIYKGDVLIEPPEKAVGFVYLIQRTNILEDNKRPILYIGKKLFYGTGRTNKGIESDWLDYYGSCKPLTDDIKKYGKDIFDRHIIQICYSKSELAWEEIRHQIDNHVLRYDKFSVMKKKYYNGNIFGKFYHDKFFIKEDIDRVKEYISDHSHQQYTIYITNGIITKSVNTSIEDIDDILMENPEWRIGSTIHAHTSDTRWVNNGIKNQLISKDKVDEFLNNNTDYIKGFFAPSLHNLCNVTNGDITMRINEGILTQFLEDNLDFWIGTHLKNKICVVNDGINIKRIYRCELDEFMKHNNQWTLGNIKKEPRVLLHNYTTYTSIYVPKSHTSEFIDIGWELPKHKCISSLYKWITKDGVDQKINPIMINEYINDGWTPGRSICHNKGKLSIVKDSNIKYIYQSDIDKYVSDGWTLSGKKRNTLKTYNKTYVCNDNTKQQKIIHINEVDIFLENNKKWRIGQFKRDQFNTNNKVFAVNMYTNERVCISKDEYKNQPDVYTSIKTRRVKIKSNGTYIYEGYLRLFCTEHEYSELPFKKAIRKRKKGAVKILKGKNLYLNKHKYVVEVI